MKILYLCTFYHRALLFRQQMDTLIKRGHEVKVFSSAQHGEGIAEKFLPIMDDQVVHCECWNKWDRIFFFPRQWKIEKRLIKAYDLKSFDLLHSHLMLSSGYTALRMKKRYGLPYVVSVRDTDLTGFIRVPFFKSLAKKIMEEANGILFLSHTHKKTLISMFSNEKTKKMIEAKSTVIGNCVEPFWEENTAASAKKLGDSKKVKVLTVAKIRPVKNIPMAAEAVQLLRKRGYDAQLTVVGENQDNSEFNRITAFDHVTTVPFLKKEELIGVYRSNDVFLLPSLGETFGRVYVEAMTQGLPVLYTKGEGFDGNYPDGEVGYAVPSDNASLIADYIEEVIRNYDRLSVNAIDHCKDFYEEVIMDRIDEFYRTALSNR